MNTPLPPQVPQPTPPLASAVERHSIAQMIGEFLREAAVLVFVFIPLDLALQNHALTFGWGLAIVGIPALFFTAGVLIERKRRT